MLNHYLMVRIEELERAATIPAGASPVPEKPTKVVQNPVQQVQEGGGIEGNAEHETAESEAPCASGPFDC